MSGRRLHNMPKFIRLRNSGNYSVQVSSRQKKGEKTEHFYVGTYDFIEDAIKAMDKWIDANMDKLNGYIPRGIAKHRDRYEANICFNGKRVIIGYFGTIEEAVKYRKEVLLGLL